MKDFKNKNNTYLRNKGRQNIVSIILFLLLILIFTSACSTSGASESSNSNTDETNLTIAVSVAPQKSIVEKIAMDKAKVITMIPQGYSPENYQPKPSSLEELSNANIYFTIDVPTETANILPSLTDLNSNIKLVDLFDAVADEYKVLSFDLYEEFDTNDNSHEVDEHTEATSHNNHDHEGEEHVEATTDHDDEHEHGEEVQVEITSHENHNHDGLDTHIWLSPKRVKIMAKVVLDEIILADSENKDFYTENYDNFITELDELDTYIRNSLKDQNNKSFIIYHPSLGYYADDYNLNMIAIEENGKAATAKSLEKVIEFSKANNIRVIFYQSEIDNSQVKVIASEVDGDVIEINPLSENLIENLYMMTDTLKNNLK